jgi:putative ABC transport system permease protein
MSIARQLDGLKRDLRQTLRGLVKNPGFSAAVILILALGIGANTAIFSVFDAVILRPLPYEDPDALMMLPASHRPDDMGREVSVANFLDWRRESRSFRHMGAFGPASLNLAGEGMAERLEGASITPGALAAIGTTPILGRLFLPEEEKGDSRVVLLSYGLWKTRFAGDPNILGRVLRLSGYAYPVVGVMPPEFRFPSPEVRLWVPVRITEERAKNRRSKWLYAVGRLENGVSREEAQREMDGITAALAAAYPKDNENWGVRVVPLQEDLVGTVRPALAILLATVFLVLGAACANIANLQLARAASRRREMAIRGAMGASAPAIVRQLLCEGLGLAALGGALGVLVAQAALSILRVWAAGSVPRLEEVGIDTRVLLFALGVSLFTGVIFGLVPARAALSADLVGDLAAGARTSGAGLKDIRFRRILTAAEVAAALVLMIGAGLLVSSLSRLRRVEPGFDSARVTTAQIVLSAARYPDDAKALTFFDELFTRISREPGIESAAGINTLPFSGSNRTESYLIEGKPPENPNDLPEAGFRVVTTDYFRTLRIPILAGRAFTQADAAGAPSVVLVNRTFANRNWPGESAVGRRIFFDAGGPPSQVIGVVGDVHHRRAEIPPVPEIYAPYAQSVPDNAFLVVRSDLPAGEVGARVRAIVAGLDPELPVFHVRPLNDVLEKTTSETRLYTSLLASFAGLALVLAVLGVYGVISYSVAQRRRELAVRLALGARRLDLLRLVAGEGLAMAAVGIAVGLALALGGSRAMGSLLFGVAPNDPFIFAVSAALLAGVALVASLLPAARAARTDPLAALRSE